MKPAEVEPFFGAPVIVTVAIANLDDTLYVGTLSVVKSGAARGFATRGMPTPQRELRLALRPLANVPAAYRQRAVNGLAQCPVSAITTIARLDDD